MDKVALPFMPRRPREAAPSRKSRLFRPRGPWVAARKTVQIVALFAFLALFISSQRGGWPANLVNLPMRLDPLAAFANLLASRTFLAGSALALVVLILTLVFGRAWCGWLCPLGTVLDLFSLDRLRTSWGKPRQPFDKTAGVSEGWRGVKYGLLLLILVAALLGNLTLLVFDPLTLFIRTLTTAIWPAVYRVVTAGEQALYEIPWLQSPIAAFDAWIRPAVLPAVPFYYRQALLFAAVFGGVIALNLVASRFWCRYLCPLGGMLGLLSKLSLFRRQVGLECKGCTLCTQVCPTGTIDPAKNYASDPGECTLCMDCLEACPRSGIVFTPGLSIAEWNGYDPGRRQALFALGTAAAALALFRSDALARRESPHLLRPPGARENNLLSKCVRCGECMRACPTGGLQPAISEAGLEGVWTPILIPRLGYCDYSCNACGLVCPVQAIPPLALEAKRTQVIGRAYINQNRCIAWSDHRPCIVCEEMCPLPEKAIWLEDIQFTGRDGQPVDLQLPHMDRQRCIGCGICEYKCPVNGEAAIRVYVPTSTAPA
ncbi:MAG TPA: 4Fe-4S binding protein [Anaerolineales bacterium]